MSNIVKKIMNAGVEYDVPAGISGNTYTEGTGIDITNNVISADMTTAVYDNTTSGATATNVQDAIDEVFQSVSNGKELLADAITDKGVQTSASDSFQTMATNIGLIDTSTIYDKFFRSALNNWLNWNFYYSWYWTYRYTYKFVDSDLKRWMYVVQWLSWTQWTWNTLYVYFDWNNNVIVKQMANWLNFYSTNIAVYSSEEPNKIYFCRWSGSVWLYTFYYDVENDEFVTPDWSDHAVPWTATRYNSTDFDWITFTAHADATGSGTLLYITPVNS